MGEADSLNIDKIISVLLEGKMSFLVLTFPNTWLRIRNVQVYVADIKDDEPVIVNSLSSLGILLNHDFRKIDQILSNFLSSCVVSSQNVGIVMCSALFLVQYTRASN